MCADDPVRRRGLWAAEVAVSGSFEVRQKQGGGVVGEFQRDRRSDADPCTALIEPDIEVDRVVPRTTGVGDEMAESLSEMLFLAEYRTLCVARCLNANWWVLAFETLNQPDPVEKPSLRFSQLHEVFKFAHRHLDTRELTAHRYEPAA